MNSTHKVRLFLWRQKSKTTTKTIVVVVTVVVIVVAAAVVIVIDICFHRRCRRCIINW